MELLQDTLSWVLLTAGGIFVLIGGIGQPQPRFKRGRPAYRRIGPVAADHGDLGAGLLEDGQVGISATNRNFKGRMGHRSARAYLSSPAVVAASAIAGRGARQSRRQETRNHGMGALYPGPAR